MGHLKADLAWAGIRLVLAGQKRVTLPRKELPSATPERHPRAHVLGGLRVPMRDGVTLATDVYLPADADGRPAGDAFPAILIRMPYGIREPYAYMPAIGRYWARRGYACVAQDVRGKYGSEGEWDPFRHEIDDGYDAIEWTASQPWCDGRVGMTGESYFGAHPVGGRGLAPPGAALHRAGRHGLRRARAALRGRRAGPRVDCALGV